MISIHVTYDCHETRDCHKTSLTMNAMLLVALAFVPIIASQTHVPARPTGYTLQQGSTIVLEAYYDLLCPDSKASWPTLQKLMTQYKSQLTVILHLFPLPFHHDAFFATQAAETVIATHPSAYKDFVSLMFEQQEKMKAGAVNMTEPQVMNLIAQIVESGKLGITAKEIASGFTNDSITETAILAWKTASQRGINDTPSFVVNRILVAEAENFDMEDWVKFIENLLKK
ncbi:uncharacterized protein [Oscarella lobularis]|uniref:uncharacterized protein n=1 Tax=Oscarella lobularis TaxID=121494 RepID=UPI003313ED9B